MANKELPALPTATLTTGCVLYLVDADNNSRKVSLADLAQWIKVAESIVPASNPWRGARITRTSNQSVATGTTATVSWQAADIDTSSFYSAATPTRLTVPSGVTKVRLTGGIRWTTNSTGLRQMTLLKNGVAVAGRFANQAVGMIEQNATSGVLSVVAGDYFEMTAFQGSGAAIDVLTNNSTWFEIEVVEGTP